MKPVFFFYHFKIEWGVNIDDSTYTLPLKMKHWFERKEKGEKEEKVVGIVRLRTWMQPFAIEANSSPPGPNQPRPFSPPTRALRSIHPHSIITIIILSRKIESVQQHWIHPDRSTLQLRNPGIDLQHVIPRIHPVAAIDFVEAKIPLVALCGEVQGGVHDVVAITPEWFIIFEAEVSVMCLREGGGDETGRFLLELP